MDLKFWKKRNTAPIPMEVREAAAKGASLLDASRQGWWQLIDGDTLDLLHPFNCVLGQVYGSYGRGLAALNRGTPLDVEEFGFLPLLDPDARGLLKAAWLAEVAKRREAASAAS